MLGETRADEPKEEEIRTTKGKLNKKEDCYLKKKETGDKIYFVRNGSDDVI
jgi:hypothetical protein